MMRRKDREILRKVVEFYVKGQRRKMELIKA